MIRHLFSEAVNALGHYRLRAGLTMLSVIWGVASLVLLISYGDGFSAAVVGAFDQIGKDLIVVFPGQTSLQAGGERAGRGIPLEIRDVQALTEGVPTLEAVSPEVRRYWPVNHGYRTRNYSVNGVYASFGRIRNTEVEAGRFLSEEDVQHRRRVVVIGANVKRELFGERSPLDSVVYVNGVRFSVIGILRKKTQVTNYSMPDDMTAFVPYTTLGTMTDARYLDDIVVLPASNTFRDRFIQELRACMARVHNFNARDERAVSIYDWNRFRTMVTSISTGLRLLMLIIGTLTLSIGAVGVMNIMLVSVTERTREIGILKSLGARRWHILLQVLIEGVAITVTGGLIGLLLAFAVVKAIGTLPLLGPLFEDTTGRGDIHLQVSLAVVAVSVSVLVGIGLVAALIPAVRAARLDPVQAIRGE